jgi:hypothetical protein
MFNPTTTPIELNELGQSVWCHKTDKTLFVERSYNWCDRVIVLEETEGRRKIVDDAKFTTFDFTNWVPMTQKQFDSIKSNFKEIYENAGDEPQATQ